MKRIYIIILSLFLILGISSMINANENQVNIDKENLTQTLYGDLKYIDKFYWINVYLRVGDKDIEKISQETNLTNESSDEYLTDYLKLRIKNNMANIPIMNNEESRNWLINTHNKTEKKAAGRFYVEVWLLGDSYPIVFNIEASFGNANEVIWEAESLGYTNISDLEEEIKDIIDNFVEKASVMYFKMKDEM